MKLLILSDLHLDTQHQSGICKWDEREFIACIEQMRSTHQIDKIVLNGDIYELFKYDYNNIAHQNPALIAYLSHPDFIYIKGNHDIINTHGADSYDVTNSKGQKIHIEHGHKADWLNGTILGRFISKYALSALNKLSRYEAIRRMYLRAVEFDDEINRIPKKYNSYKYLTYALRLLKEYDVVILGHTHKMESHHTYYLNKKKRYLNCGACSLGRFQAVVLNTETLEYEMIKTDSKQLLSNPRMEIIKELLTA